MYLEVTNPLTRPWILGCVGRFQSMVLIFPLIPATAPRYPREKKHSWGYETPRTVLHRGLRWEGKSVKIGHALCMTGRA